MSRRMRHALWFSLALVALILTAVGCRPGSDEIPAEAAPTLSGKLTPTPESTVEPAPTEAASPTIAPTEPPAPSLTPTAGEAQALQGGVIQNVTSSGDGITGTGIIDVEVANPEDEAIVFVIPAGFVFLPPEGSGEQRMMVLREEAVVIEPGQTVVVSPFVSCIDSDQAAPGEGSGYTAGNLVEDEDLLAFAQCTSEAGDLPDSLGMDFAANLGLQFAVWQVASGQGITDFFDDAEQGQGALGDSMPPEMMEFFDTFLGGAADETELWLERCGVATE